MRLISAILMVILLLSPSLLRLVLLGHYQLNKAEITRLHCINRDKPMLHCEGKCYLQAQLQKAQEQQENTEGIFAGWDKADDCLPLGNFGWELVGPAPVFHKAVLSYLTRNCPGCNLDVFRPPPPAAARLSLNREANSLHPIC